MATSKSTSRKGRTGSRSSNSSGSKNGSSPKARASGSSRSRAGSGKRRSSKATKDNGVVGTVKNVASKAGTPALAVGAAAAGLAGGLALKRRSRRTKVLGVTLPELDVKSVAKTMGKASKQLGQTSKSVSKDIDRVGDQAERIGKVLD